LQAVTRVKPEQASKVKSWTPTCLDIREGCTDREVIDTCTGWVHRGNGHGMQGRWCGRVGEPQSGRSSTSTLSLGRAAWLGLGEGHSTVEAGQCRWREGPSLLGAREGTAIR